LARKPKPTRLAANTSQPVLARSCARTSPYAPSVSDSTSSASGLLNRNISTATGVSAIAAPASRPAAGAARRPAPSMLRRTVAYSTPTVATPINACGTRMLHALTPKIRADRTIGHSAAGVLSTVMELPASDEPKKNAFQLVAPAWTAAE
jgi:hypothetical protein